MQTVTGLPSRPVSIPHPEYILSHQRAVGALGGDTASTGSVLPPFIQAASGNGKQPIFISVIIGGQAARVNAAMGCEGNETFSNG